MTTFFYRGYALHVRLTYPCAVFVHPGYDTDRNYLLLRAGDLDAAKLWCDKAVEKAQRRAAKRAAPKV